MGAAESFLQGDAFSAYIDVMTQLRSRAPLEAASPDRLHLPVSLTAYGRYCVGGRLPGLPQPDATEEEIFWGLLRTQRPEYIAAAARERPARPLGELARQTLLEIAGITFAEARDMARDCLVPAREGWQTFSEWRDTYGPLAGTIYAQEQPSLWHSLKKGKNRAMALANLTCAVARGLWGRPRC